MLEGQRSIKEWSKNSSKLKIYSTEFVVEDNRKDTADFSADFCRIRDGGGGSAALPLQFILQYKLMNIFRIKRYFRANLKIDLTKNRIFYVIYNR